MGCNPMPQTEKPVEADIIPHLGLVDKHPWGFCYGKHDNNQTYVVDDQRLTMIYVALKNDAHWIKLENHI